MSMPSGLALYSQRRLTGFSAAGDAEAARTLPIAIKKISPTAARFQQIKFMLAPLRWVVSPTEEDYRRHVRLLERRLLLASL
jgi:hypothetical protein